MIGKRIQQRTVSLPIEQFLTPVSSESACGDNKWDDLAYSSILGGELDSILGTNSGMVAGEREDSGGGDWRNFLAQVGGFFSLTKHLGLANYALMADLHISGLSGLADGLIIINRFLASNWEDIHPIIDEGDAEERLEFIENLNDPLILGGIDEVVIANGRQSGAFTLAEFNSSQKDNDPSPSLVEASINETLRESPEHFETLKEQLQEIHTQLDAIEETITTHLPEESISLQALRNKLKELTNALSSASGEPASQAGTETETGAEGGTLASAPPQVSGEINSREDVVKAINRIVRFYSKNEPTSPVPLLLERTKRIVTMDFLQVIEEFDLKNRALPFDELFGQSEDNNEY